MDRSPPIFMAPGVTVPSAGCGHQQRGTLVWTPELVQRFWDWQGSHSDPSGYFTAQVPDALLNLIAATIPHKVVILDFGCGLGLLGGPLMDRGFGYIASDPSPVSLNTVKDRLSSHPGWKGAVPMVGGRLALAEASVDAVILFEALEHLLDDQVEATCRELHRVLRPGGRLLVSVPHQEQMHAKLAYCPVCRQSFHRMQHQRCFDRSSLRDLLESHGFDTVHCLAGDLVELQVRTMRNPLRWSAFYLARRLHLGWGRLLASVSGRRSAWLRAAFPGHGPHLIWCGARR